MTVLEELRRAVDDPGFFDDGASDATWSCYFGAAAFHGLAIEHDNVPEIYSYAMEAAEALGL